MFSSNYLNCSTLLFSDFFLIDRLGRFIGAVEHDGTVDAVALMKSSAHKRLCISGARDRALIIWDVDTIIVRASYSFLAVFIPNLSMNLSSDLVL